MGELMEQDLPEVDPAIVQEAAKYAYENGVLLACPGTEQGYSGWYFDERGHRGQWDVDESGNWTLVQEWEMNAANEWTKVDIAIQSEPDQELSEAEKKFAELDEAGDGSGFLSAEALEP